MLPGVAFDKRLYMYIFHLFCKVCDCVDEDATRHENDEPTDEHVSDTSKEIVINWKASHESRPYRF